MRIRIISSILAVVVLLSAYSVTFGIISSAIQDEATESEPTKEELLDLAEKAVIFRNITLSGSLYGIWKSLDDLRNSPSKQMEWLLSLGYFEGEFLEKYGSELLPCIDRHTGEIIPDPIYDEMPYTAFPEEITIERLKEDYLKLFYHDRYEIFSCIHEHVPYGQPGGKACYEGLIRTDENGRVYAARCENNFGDIWNRGESINVELSEITYRSDKRIVLSVNTGELDYAGDIEFRKTADGWRVYGGCDTFDTGFPPPQTGDSTPIYLTVSLLSLGVLTATVSVTVRKRKKAL